MHLVSRRVLEAIKGEGMVVMSEKIFVTRPHLPPLEELMPYLEMIWQRRVLTNGGPYHVQLEQALCETFGAQYVSLFNNGTIALLTSLQALGLTGEIITTPFSFVATSHCLLWLGLTPVFVDIDPHTLNIDPRQVEAAITPRTSAILAVHCYGRPCDTSALADIAGTHGLKILYDAAHAFGVLQDGKSILNKGDLSSLSFHATKVFNTFEGGAVVSHDAAIRTRIEQLKNFGITGETSVDAVGINGKLNEFSAALGLVQLGHVEQAVAERGKIDSLYRDLLKNVPGIHCLEWPEGSTPNYAYFPILVEDDFPLGRDELYEKFKDNDIFSRRYFYPLISEFAMYRHLPSAAPDNLPVATAAAKKVLCLPIYPDLPMEQAKRIVGIIAGERDSV